MNRREITAIDLKFPINEITIVMKKTNNAGIVSDESLMNKIYLIRGKKVMWDRDLAKLYGVSTGNLNLAVKRNKNRFPEDFMFVLRQEEFENLILQFAISRNGGWGGARKLPNVFTEQGVSMPACRQAGFREF